MEALEAYLSGNRTVALWAPRVSASRPFSTACWAGTGRRRKGCATTGGGRHTTTYRELVPLERGGLVLDTPGMRELALWDAEGGVDETFSDVAELAAQCRFADCAHVSEPGCAPSSRRLQTARCLQSAWRAIASSSAS